MSHQATTATFQNVGFHDILFFGRGNVHMVAQTVPSLLLHDDEGQNEDIRIESAGWVDTKTRFELAFEYTPGDVGRVVLIYGFDTSSTDVKELNGRIR